MPIPQFTIDGALPPYLGIDPGGDPYDMSPYEVSLADVVNHFSTTDKRKDILANWIRYRQGLRSIGIKRGFQWLDGSFLEDKVPNDLDIVVLLHRPTRHRSLASFNKFILSNQGLLNKGFIKSTFNLDVLIVDLDGNIDTILKMLSYYLQLFSHQRNTFAWKGTLQVRQDDMGDEIALLASLTAPTPGVHP